MGSRLLLAGLRTIGHRDEQQLRERVTASPKTTFTILVARTVLLVESADAEGLRDRQAAVD